MSIYHTGRRVVCPYIYRHLLRKVLLEFPAGHIEDDEDSEKTVRRELLEET